MRKLFLCTALLLLACTGNAYRRDDFAIVFIGGYDSVYGQPTPIAIAIRNAYPDIPFVELKIGDGTQGATHTGLYRQLDQIYKFALQTPALNGKHAILIGGSQGGVLAQGFIEMYGDKLPFAIDSLMTIASPIGGEYGLPDSWENTVDTVVFNGDKILLQQLLAAFGIKEYIFSSDDGARTLTLGEAVAEGMSVRDITTPVRKVIAAAIKKLVKKDFGLIRFIFYNPLGQDLISIAGYWRDPMHRLDYLAFNAYLPYINNEREHVNAARYKANMSALQYAVFFWAGKDNVVKPPCSGAKRFYKWGSKTDVEAAFTDTMQYQQNLLGLKTLYDAGRLVIQELPNDTHSCDSSEAIAAGLQQFATIVGASKASEAAELQAVAAVADGCMA
ncbi:MAG: hypothetical protein M1549_03710 [Candidatus Dependentiae bacterium]|nr:hypothetical protein [Candidatus Dependentiae bacterium]